jgi:hypothetical protein
MRLRWASLANEPRHQPPPFADGGRPIHGLDRSLAQVVPQPGAAARNQMTASASRSRALSQNPLLRSDGWLCGDPD